MATPTVSDVESVDFNTGTLTVSFTAGSDSAEDVLAIRNQGTGAGQIGVSGSNVTYGGVTIGSFAGGSGGADLVVTFNASSTAAAAQALIRNITFQDTDTNAPTTGARTVRFVLTDGDGGGSGNHDTTVTVTAVNDAPVLADTALTLTVAEDAGVPSGAVGSLISAFTGGISDVDSGAVKGIAVTASDETNGTWYYTTNGGTNWTAVGTVSSASSLLLADNASTRLYFAPAANYNGSSASALTVRGWDQTSGTAGTKVSTASTQTVLDQFGPASYSNNNGSQNWSGSWVETDSNGGGVGGGRIRISGGQLDIQAHDIGDNLYREANLGSATSATLSFDYNNGLGSGDQIVIQISNNGGSSYSTLAGGTFSSAANIGAGTFNFDITSYISTNTRIRFYVSAEGAHNNLLIDNAQISYSVPNTGGTTAFSSATDVIDVTVTPVNDTPVVTSASLTLSEGQTVTLSGANFGITDPDSASFTYTVSAVTGGYFQLSTAPGTPITTFTSADLAGNLVQFVDDGNEVAPSFSVTVNDGSVNSNTLAASITYTPVNDTPVIANLAGDTLAYAEGDGAVVIEQGGNATVSDVNSVDFNTGTLTVSFTAGSDSAEDVLAIRNQGTGAGQIGVSGSNVTYGGVTIGSFAGGSGGADLVVTFNASSTAAAAQALIRNITFQDTDTNAPTTGARTVRFVLTDGDGGGSGNHDTTVTVSAVNDTPVIANLAGDTLAYAEGDGAVVIEQGGNATVSDVELGRLQHRHADGVVYRRQRQRRGRAGDPQPGHGCRADWRVR